jgi:hypothetical protein
MNSYKLNGIIAGAARISICRYLKIKYNTLYKEIKNITPDGIVITRDGQHYLLTLEPIKIKNHEKNINNTSNIMEYKRNITR